MPKKDYTKSKSDLDIGLDPTFSGGDKAQERDDRRFDAKSKNLGDDGFKKIKKSMDKMKSAPFFKHTEKNY